jgi:predicted nucleotidyltransferase
MSESHLPDNLDHCAPTDAALQDLLSQHAKVRLAILFGSCATGTAKPDSYLDLAVLADRPIDTEVRLRLIEDLAERFGRPVDLIDLRTVGEPLLGEILKGRRILGDDTAYARLITRHLLDAADFLPYRERILAERRKQWTDS